MTAGTSDKKKVIALCVLGLVGCAGGVFLFAVCVSFG